MLHYNAIINMYRIFFAWVSLISELSALVFLRLHDLQSDYWYPKTIQQISFTVVN